MMWMMRAMRYGGGGDDVTCPHQCSQDSRQSGNLEMCRSLFHPALPVALSRSLSLSLSLVSSRPTRLKFEVRSPTRPRPDDNRPARSSVDVPTKPRSNRCSAPARQFTAAACSDPGPPFVLLLSSCPKLLVRRSCVVQNRDKAKTAIAARPFPAASAE